MKNWTKIGKYTQLFMNIMSAKRYLTELAAQQKSQKVLNWWKFFLIHSGEFPTITKPEK